MAGLLPSSSEVEQPERDPQVIGVDDEDADRLLSALSSETARELFATVHEEPATPSELADDVGTSLQNAQYHLGKLEDANLIEVADTRYSAKGREMNVYAPTGAPVVLFAGSSDDGENVKTVLTNLLGGVGVLGLASLVIQRLYGDGIQVPSFASSGAGGDAGAAGDAGGATATSTTAGDVGVMAEPTMTRTTETAAQYTADAAAGLPPGLVFFLGGLLVLCLVGAAWYLRR